MEERIRDILTIWAGKILDYAHRDYYELVRFYYRQRVEAFLTHAEANLAAHRAIVDDKQLEPAYQQIEQSFVKKPFVVAPQERYARRPGSGGPRDTRGGGRDFRLSTCYRVHSPLGESRPGRAGEGRWPSPDATASDPPA